jgi:hypothetical protein
MSIVAPGALAWVHWRSRASSYDQPLFVVFRLRLDGTGYRK